MAVTSEKIDVLQVVVVDEEDPEFNAILEARLYPEAVWLGSTMWQVVGWGSTHPITIYPEEIDAYIELLTAMKNYKKED